MTLPSALIATSTTTTASRPEVFHSSGTTGWTGSIARGSRDTSGIGTNTVFGFAGGAGGVGASTLSVPWVSLIAPATPSPVVVARSPWPAVASGVTPEFGGSTWVWVAVGGGSVWVGRGRGRCTTLGGSSFGGGGGSTLGGGGGLGSSGRHAWNRTTVGGFGFF